MNKIKVATIGYGHLGRWHAQKAQALEQAELVAIVEPSEEGKEKAQLAHPEVKIVNDVSEVIDSIDAAIIVTPTSTHFELTKYLLEHGKHVFCEKPLCSTYSEVKQLKDYLNEGNVLQVGHSERCHQAWELLKENFSQINSHFSLKLNRVAAFKGRATDVDVVQDLMIHDLDLVLYLFNQRPVRLKAFGHKIRTGKWDNATCLLEFADGSHAKITAGRNHVKEIRSLEVVHDGGCIYVDLFTNEYSIATDGQFDDGSYVKHFQYEKRDHLLLEQNNFFNAILGKEQPMVNFTDGAVVVYLLDKVAESLDEKKYVELDYSNL
jgi:predicted dehydrogenase